MRARDRVALRRLVPSLHASVAVADHAWEKAAALVPPGRLLCRAGCFGCCVGSFEISFSEALVVRAAVDGLPAGERAAVRARAARLVARGAALFPGDSESGILDPERSDEKDDAYFDSVEHVACPLLDLPAGRCLAYDSRPVTCRTYGLAWVENTEIVHPACPLNLDSAAPAQVLETAIDVAPLLSADCERAELARQAGLPGGAATTIAYALVGRAFEAKPRP